MRYPRFNVSQSISVFYSSEANAFLPTVGYIRSSHLLIYRRRVCIGHVGGLLALFLGASLITCLELCDVIAQRYLCACARHRPAQHRKRCRRKSSLQHHDANHAHFRSVNDVTSSDTPLPVYANHNNDLSTRAYYDNNNYYYFSYYNAT